MSKQLGVGRTRFGLSQSQPLTATLLSTVARGFCTEAFGADSQVGR